MKKILILITAVLFAVQISNAQTQKGAQTLGGSLSFTHTNFTSQSLFPYASTLQLQEIKATNFSIGPTYGYFISDNLEIGALLSYSASSNSSSTTYTTNSIVDRTLNSFGGSLFLRKYCLYQNKIGIRTGAYAGYTRGNTKFTSTETGSIVNSSGKNNIYIAGANLDLVYYPSKTFGLAATLASLAYSNNKEYNVNGLESSTKNENLGFNFINSGLTLTAFYVFGTK